MGDMVKPKSMVQVAGKMSNTNNDYFYNKGNRPPSARSNAISEIEMNSDA